MPKTFSKKIIQAFSVLLVVLLLLFSVNITAYASEEVNVIDLKMAKTLAVKNSRTNNYAKIPQLERDIEKNKGDLNDANVRDDSNTGRLVKMGKG